MKQYKKDRLRKLVSWGYIHKAQAIYMWRDYLRLFRRVTESGK